MKCLNVPQIYLYLEKEFSPAENKRIEEHLVTCSKCKKALEERKLFLQAAESLPLWQTPPGFSQQVMGKIFPFKVPLSAWLTTSFAGFISIIITLYIFSLVTGQNLMNLLSTFSNSLWNGVKNLSIIFVKLFKLASVSITIILNLLEYVFKSVSWLTTIISPQVQIIIITITIILIASFILGIKRKILVGEKT